MPKTSVITEQRLNQIIKEELFYAQCLNAAERFAIKEGIWDGIKGVAKDAGRAAWGGVKKAGKAIDDTVGTIDAGIKGTRDDVTNAYRKHANDPQKLAASYSEKIKSVLSKMTKQIMDPKNMKAAGIDVPKAKEIMITALRDALGVAAKEIQAAEAPAKPAEPDNSGASPEINTAPASSEDKAEIRRAQAKERRAKEPEAEPTTQPAKEPAPAKPVGKKQSRRQRRAAKTAQRRTSKNKPKQVNAGRIISGDLVYETLLQKLLIKDI